MELQRYYVMKVSSGMILYNPVKSNGICTKPCLLNEQFQKKCTPTPRKATGNSLGEGGLKSQNLRSKV